MAGTKLRHAPLKEVIFELYWECATDGFGVQHDPGFDLAQGKLADRLEEQFPVHKKLLPDGLPLKLVNMPLHQYWTGELTWPVVQHGQGVLVVNEVEAGYDWEKSFKPMLLSVVEKLQDSYDKPLPFNRIKLQYIDAYDLNGQDALNFMDQNLQTRIENAYELPGSLSSFNLQQIFSLANGSNMVLNISNAVNNNNQAPSVFWTTSVEKQQRMELGDVVQWLEEAHTSTSTMFKKMLNPDFYASLR